MPRATRAVCPHCGSPLKSGRGVRVGKTVQCPRCAASFTVQGDEAGPAPGARGWAPPPAGQPSAPGEIDGSRLVLVAFGALLYLLGGGALAVYCFTRNAAPPPAPSAPPVVQARPPNDSDDRPVPPPPSPPVSPTDAAEQRKIDDAIARGVWYLRDHALPEGSWGDALPDGQAPVTLGFASLPALTLLECGVPSDEPVIQKAAALVRRQAPAPHDVYDTYQRALAVLFLDRLGDQQDEGLIQYLALCLAAGQHPGDGAWSYSCPALDRKKVPQLLEQLQAAKSVADWRKSALAGTPLPPDWDQGAAVPKDWDNSNTQFAILALWVARRHHVPIEQSIALAEDHFRRTQLGHQDDPEGNNLDMDGSWYYARSGGSGWHNSSRWPSMTCAGLLGLAEAQALHQGTKAKPLDDPAIQRGLAMLAREIGRPGEARPTDLYFLWSLERVGVLFRLPQIGDKDWYAWGCQALLPNQGDDGAWKDGVFYDNVPVLNTCFALLFLKQANLAEDLTSKLRLLGGEK